MRSRWISRRDSDPVQSVTGRSVTGVIDGVVCQIAEPRELAFEMQLDGADRAVTLFGDDTLGHIVAFFHAFLPVGVTLVEFIVIFFRTAARLVALQIIFFT